MCLSCLHRRLGFVCLDTRISFTSTSPATATWRLALVSCLECTFHKISIHLIVPSILPISGGDGTYHCRDACETTCTSRLEGIEAAKPRLTGTCCSRCFSAACGTAPHGRS